MCFGLQVHGIVALQMAVAIGLMCVTLYADAMNEYFASRSDMSYLGLVLGLVVVSTAHACDSLRVR